MRGFLYWLAVRHDRRLLAVAGFGRVAHRLNFFVSGALRIASLHRRQITKSYMLITKRYLTFLYNRPYNIGSFNRRTFYV